MWWCEFIDWFNFETHPSSLLNFGRLVPYNNCLTLIQFLSETSQTVKPKIPHGRSFPVHGSSKTSVWWLPWKDDSKSKIVCSRWWSQISIALNPFLHLKMLQVRLPACARLRSVLRSRTGTAQSPVQMADKWTTYRIVLKTSTKQSRSQMVRLPFLTFDMVRTFHIN